MLRMTTDSLGAEASKGLVLRELLQCDEDIFPSMTGARDHFLKAVPAALGLKLPSPNEVAS